MSIALVAVNRNMEPWREAMLAIDPSLRIEIYPEIENPEAISAAVLWKPPADIFDKLPNLQWVSSLGAGVDSILRLDFNQNILLTRIVDEELAQGMTRTVVMAVLAWENELAKYLADQREKVWQPNLDKPKLAVGILGLGHLGKAAGKALSGLGYEVYGFSRSRRNDDHIECFAGENEISTFLSKVNVVVCLLPLTDTTSGMLNHMLFQKMQAGSYLINVARGEQLVDEDLIRALDEGLLGGAYLDVFNEEPLPPAHDFWNHPKITITPHVASITNIESAAKQIVKNYQRLTKGEALINQVDLDRGY